MSTDEQDKLDAQRYRALREQGFAIYVRYGPVIKLQGEEADEMVDALIRRRATGLDWNGDKV